MTLITMTGDKVMMKDGKVGTEASCCCGAAEGILTEDSLFLHTEADNVLSQE